MDKFIGRTRPNGDKEVKKIIELSEEEAKRSVLLGNPTSTDIINCFCVAANHVERFWERVYGYRIVQDEFPEMISSAFKAAGIQEKPISVCFYEKPKEKSPFEIILEAGGEQPDFTKMTTEQLVEHFGGKTKEERAAMIVQRMESIRKEEAARAKKKSS